MPQLASFNPFLHNLKRSNRQTGRDVEFFGKRKGYHKHVLKTLANKYGKPFTEYVYDQHSGQVKGFLQFFINGKSASALAGFDSELRDGDMLAIVPPVGGG